ncbi:ATP-binding cassette domain-containing protein (plasmid) [Staphylococcus xylosus]|uniref:ATP-binding cassette domain-containing protein n=1 Tax=Staphylococcus xylosus TaxID=1288 RepID=UPI00403E7B12
MLKIKNISKKFHKKEVLSNINTAFSTNGTSIIVGINGSGKTTLLNLITTLIKSDSGNIYIDEYPIGSQEYKRELFYIPSDFYLPEYMTGEEYFSFISKVYKNKYIYDKQYFYFLAEKFDLKSYLKKSIETYSYGMKKKLQICIGMSVNTMFLLADELTNGLDFESIILLEALLDKEEKQRKIILISHSIDFISKFPNDIRILENGNLSTYEGNLTELEEHLISKGDLNEKIESIKQYNNNN